MDKKIRAKTLLRLRKHKHRASIHLAGEEKSQKDIHISNLNSSIHKSYALDNVEHAYNHNHQLSGDNNPTPSLFPYDGNTHAKLQSMQIPVNPFMGAPLASQLSNAASNNSRYSYQRVKPD